MRWKRLIYYLVINVLVSACTVLSILYLWEEYRPQVVLTPEAVVFLPTATAGQLAQPDSSEEVPLETAIPDFATYEVQPGDTLSSIAADFDVSMDEIMAANALENPDALNVGDVLIIPLTPDFTPMAEAVPEEQATSTPPAPPTLDPAAATPADFGEAVLQIVAVIGAGELGSERVVIRQSGDAQVSLLGWRIVAPGGEVFTFPQLVLFQDGAVDLYTKAGTDNVAQLHWGLDQPVWQSGAVVTLVDPDGDLVAAYQIP